MTTGCLVCAWVGHNGMALISRNICSMFRIVLKCCEPYGQHFISKLNCLYIIFSFKSSPPFLPCLTTKPVWLLLDPQNHPRNMPSSLSNIDSSGKLEKHAWQEKSNRRGTPIPVLLTGKSFSRIHSILAVQRASLDQLKTKTYEDLQCPNKQEKRVDTTFAITTTITPDSMTQKTRVGRHHPRGKTPVAHPNFAA